jgi:hypothetical protein
MFAYARALPVIKGQRRRPRESTVSAGLAVVAAAILLAGCSLAAAPVVGPDPADPNARVRPVSYRSTLGSYKSQRPVAPSDWREQNERVAPRSRQ